MIPVYVVISTCGYGDDNFNIIVYAGISYDDAYKIATTGGTFPSKSNQWNTLEKWENGKQVSEICYDV